MDFGKRLKGLRQDREMTQGELAEAVGVERNTIGRWETETFEPRLSDLLNLAKVLNVSVEELATGKQGIIRFQHGPMQLEIPATSDGYAFVEDKLREMSEEKSSAADSSKAG